MLLARGLFLAVAGTLLLLGGVAHLRDPEAADGVLRLQSAHGLWFARLAQGHAVALGLALSLVGVVALALASLQVGPHWVPSAVAAAAGGLLLVHAVQVLRQGDLPCGCMGAHGSAMSAAGLLPSAAIVASALAAQILTVGAGSAVGLELAAVVLLGVQTGVVVALLGLGLGHRSASDDAPSVALVGRA